MIKTRMAVFGLVMFGLGALWGASDDGTRQLTAQEGDSGLSQEAGDRIRAAHRTLSDAMETLRSEGRYETITEGVNAFLVMAGGGNAREDLESGRGVDPETFAAIYAGQAIPEIQDLLDTDEQGRITYNGEVVRIYSKSRLQRIFADRVKLTEVGF